MEEMAKAYEPQSVEDALYKKWEAQGYFNPDNCSGEPYTIMMPPPNVTGVLHLGHALENSLMDAMARFQRLRGKKVLLVPGTDHAALPTQAKVEKLLMADGVKNPRKELGRDALVAKIREFADNSKATILSQVRKMGTSADWSRLAYTFDEPRNKAVNELFTRMYNDGLIYRGYRVVNWSVKGQSTSSDDEIETIERAAVLYTFTYSADFPIAIASTRPETKLGDTAVAVHPSDERYQQYIGKTFTVDVGAAQPLQIRVIADENVDPAFGTGALGVTPAHSAIDFGMYEKQKAAGSPIGIVQVIGADGRMTAEAGEYAGLTVEEAREKFVAWLRGNNLLVSEVETVQNVGTSDRYGDVIEAIPMTQWWLDVNKVIPSRGKTLRDLMREAVTTGLGGDATQKVNITPDRFTKLYLDRVDNLRDWCLSRQIWWGHRIPAWYREVESRKSKVESGEIYVGVTAPEGEGWKQDEDTLDTWFSSSTWTFSTLGWPPSAKAAEGRPSDLETFHPTSWMTMGYEILYLWLMRMILMSTYALEEIPFKDAYIHGILRDKDGKKFSKSSGNGIDPIEVINEYGCDALRLSLLTGISPGNDSKFYTEKVESSRNFVNKVWNISRFIDMSTGGLRHVDSVQPVTLADRWILSRFHEVAAKTGMLLEQFDFSLAAETLREFTWSDFADWYLEIAKVEKGKEDILNYILERLLVLWHPFMPFVTEEIYTRFDRGMIIVAQWPAAIVIPSEAEGSLVQFTKLQEAITAIRNIRSEYKVEPKKLVDVVMSDDSLMPYTDVICALGRVENLVVGAKPEAAASAVVGGLEISIALAGLVDVAKEKVRMTDELVSVEKYIVGIRARLDGGDFVKNAPEKVVAMEKAKLEEAEARRTKLAQALAALE